MEKWVFVGRRGKQFNKSSSPSVHIFFFHSMTALWANSLTLPTASTMSNSWEPFRPFPVRSPTLGEARGVLEGDAWRLHDHRTKCALLVDDCRPRCPMECRLVFDIDIVWPVNSVAPLKWQALVTRKDGMVVDILPPIDPPSRHHTQRTKGDRPFERVCQAQQKQRFPLVQPRSRGRRRG